MKPRAYLLLSIFWAWAHGTCVDNNTLCSTWVQSGFCTNTYYSCENLLDYCSMSCNVASCNPQTTCTQSAAPSGGSPPSDVAICTDSNSMCSDWESAGFCNNTYYTCDQKQQYCALTCNIGGCNPQVSCIGTPVDSAPVGADPGICPPDNNSMCSEWATSGFCTNSYYNCTVQLSYCATTCNIAACSGNTPTPCSTSDDVTIPPNSGGAPASNGPCMDNSTNCLNWKANGFCTNNFYTCDFKISYCAASCNIQACSPTYTACSGTTGCDDLSPRCAAWASTGFCQNPFYDDSYRCGYCPSTCGLCNACASITTLQPPPLVTTAPLDTIAPGGTTQRGGAKTTAAAGGTTAKGGAGTTAKGGAGTTANGGAGTTAKGGAGTTAKGGAATTAKGGAATTAKGGAATTAKGGAATTAKGGAATTAKGGAATTAKGGAATTAKGGAATTAKGGAATTAKGGAATTAKGGAATTAKGGAGTTAKGGAGTTAAPAKTTAKGKGGRK